MKLCKKILALALVAVMLFSFAACGSTPKVAMTVDGKDYWLRRAELVRDGNGPVYCWGMCVEKGGEDTWGQS